MQDDSVAATNTVLLKFAGKLARCTPRLAVGVARQAIDASDKRPIGMVQGRFEQFDQRCRRGVHEINDAVVAWISSHASRTCSNVVGSAPIDTRTIHCPASSDGVT